MVHYDILAHIMVHYGVLWPNLGVQCLGCLQSRGVGSVFFWGFKVCFSDYLDFDGATLTFSTPLTRR